MRGKLAIPKRFYRDHEDRDLPTPVALLETSRHIVIDCADPALPELLDDARHYATEGTDASPPGLVMSARLLIAAVNRQCP